MNAGNLNLKLMEYLFLTNDPDSRKKVLQSLDDLDERHKGKQVTILANFKRNKPVRSTDQNSRYWAILTAIAAEIGETREGLHYSYAVMFIPDDHEVNGQKIPRSTKELKQDEFATYMKKIEQHAKEFHGVDIKRPEDNTYSMWERYHNNRYDAMFSAI